MSFRDLGIIEVTVFAVLIAAFLLFFILFVILRRRKQAANNRKLLKQRALMEEAVQKKVRRAGEKNSRVNVGSDTVMRPEEYERFAPPQSGRRLENAVQKEHRKILENDREQQSTEGATCNYQKLEYNTGDRKEIETMREMDKSHRPEQGRVGEGMRNLLQNALDSEFTQQNPRNRVRKIERVPENTDFAGRRYEPQEEYAEEFSGRRYDSRKEYEEEFSEENYNFQNGHTTESFGKNYEKEYENRDFANADWMEARSAKNPESISWDIPEDTDFSGHSVHNVHITQEHSSPGKSPRREETLRMWDNNSKSMRMAKRSQDTPFFVEERRISHRRDQLKRLEEAK